MAVNPMLSSGVVGIQRGLQGVQQAAVDLSELALSSETQSLEGPFRPGPIPAGQAADPLHDAAAAVVSMQVYEIQVQASAKVIKTADAVIGMLLETEA